jgi:uncharacterized protein YneR
MMYKEIAAVWSDILTKDSEQSERHLEFFLNVKPLWYVRKHTVTLHYAEIH